MVKDVSALRIFVRTLKKTDSATNKKLKRCFKTPLTFCKAWIKYDKGSIKIGLLPTASATRAMIKLAKGYTTITSCY